MPALHPLIPAIRGGLRAAADPERAPQMQAYMKSEMPYYGVPAAEQKRIYRAAWKAHPLTTAEDYHNTVLELWDHATHREERYGAQETAKRFRAFQTIDALPLYRHMIVSGAWWDYVDTIAADLVGTLFDKDPETMTPLLREWIVDENLWIRRSAILSQLRRKERTDTALLYDFCERCLGEPTFWIRKSIGWALRQHSKCDPDSVRKFVETHKDKMAGLTLREASKYI